MLETIFNDVGNIFEGVFLNGDWIALAIAFGSVLVASLIMRRGTQIGSMTLLALVLFVIGGYLRGVFRGMAPADSAGANRAVNQLEYSWMQFMDLQAGTLLAYFIAFMVLILVLFGVRSIFVRS
ncbi:MAG: hypothetical protein KAH44_09300 [Oricola sp.]|jgi:mannose/fructose/N-acetylgalactosamine-specific phosphotransferase system component IIC|nr:hypothetical protein [Oricola sp.]